MLRERRGMAAHDLQHAVSRARLVKPAHRIDHPYDMTKAQIEAQREPTLPHSPYQLKSRRAWTRITDREMIEFALKHFDRHGDCTMSCEERQKRKMRSLCMAMVYHGNARWGNAGKFFLVGPMMNLRSQKYWLEEFGLVAMHYEPHLHHRLCQNSPSASPRL